MFMDIGKPSFIFSQQAKIESGDRDLIMEKAPVSEIRTLARQEGMRTLRESGLMSIFDGATSVEEVLRETMVAI